MPFVRKFAALFILLGLLPGFGSGERAFAPGVEVWDRWTKHQASATDVIDHSAWTALLKTHVRTDGNGVNLVNYSGLAADRSKLQAYLTTLGATPISRFNRNEQMAYWINLYNALTVQVILDHMPVGSIRDINISPGLLSVGPWDKKLFQIEGEDLSLNDIEHRILRPVWQDPRIHYAVNCASIGCPNLKKTAYTGKALEADLDQAARAYVNNARGVTVRNGLVTVSRIYDWFIEDFGGSEKSVLGHIRQYADPDLAAQLDQIGDLNDTQYDWSLNSAR